MHIFANEGAPDVGAYAANLASDKSVIIKAYLTKAAAAPKSNAPKGEATQEDWIELLARTVIHETSHGLYRRNEDKPGYIPEDKLNPPQEKGAEIEQVLWDEVVQINSKTNLRSAWRYDPKTGKTVPKEIPPDPKKDEEKK